MVLLPLIQDWISLKLKDSLKVCLFILIVQCESEPEFGEEDNGTLNSRENYSQDFNFTQIST